MMSKIGNQIKIHQFTVHPVVDYLKETPSEFDISAEGTDIQSDFRLNRKFCLKCYCQILFNVIITFNPTKGMRFLKHQCNSINDTIEWLNDLELFIDDNYSLIEKKHPKTLLQSWYDMIKELRESYEKRDHSRQQRTILFNEKASGGKIPDNKTIWNGQLNQLVDIHLDLTIKKTPKGKVYLPLDPPRLVDFLHDTYLDEYGHEISRDTLYTYLNKPEKLPKANKKLDVDNILNP